MKNFFILNDDVSLVDLHNHSVFSSDGEKTPQELYAMAIQQGLQVISVTDHNNVDFYHSPEFHALGDDLKIIPGIEIDCSYKNVNLHLLGYFIDVFDEKFVSIKNSYNNQEKENGVLKVKSIKQALSVVFDDENFLNRFADRIITGEDIAVEIFNNEKNHALNEIKPYLPGGLRSDNPVVSFYWDYFAQGKAAHTPITLPSLEAAVQAIVPSGGLPVIAHPGQNFRGNEQIVAEMLADNPEIVGIEVFNNYHSEEQSRYFIKLALEHGKKITKGSDFHGHHKPKIVMGSSNYQPAKFADLLA